MLPDLVPGSIEPYRGRLRARAPRSYNRITLGIVDTAEEAQELIDAFLARNKPKGLTLRVWGERWFKDRETADVKVELSRWVTHVLPSPLADMALRRVQRHHIVQFVDWLCKRRKVSAVTMGRGEAQRTVLRETDEKLSQRSVEAVLAVVRNMLSKAADTGRIPQNPALGVRVPEQRRVEEPWTWFTPDEIGALTAARLKHTQRTIFTVAIYTGLRPGELFGLRWRDVHLDGDRPYVHVCRSYDGPTKTGRVRDVPLLPQALAALRAWKKRTPGIGDALVFSARGGGCHHKGYTAGWERVVVRVGIGRRCRLYDCRHTFASHLVMGSWGRKWRIEEIQLVLGHRSRETTMRYAHLDPDGVHAWAAETPGVTQNRPNSDPRFQPVEK